MNILILGATGLVGTECLRQAIADDRISRITVLSRSPLPIRHHKIINIITPLEELENHAAAFAVDAVLCALGTTIKKAGSQEAFRKVDHDFVLRSAMLAQECGAKHYLLVSAIGANPRSKIFYNRIKGEAETAIIRLSFRQITIVRPSLLLGQRQEFRPGEWIGQFFAPFIPGKYKPVHARDVAAALIASLFRAGSGVQFIESKDIVSHARQAM